MNVTPSSELPGLMVITPPVFRDERGDFRELFHASRYAEAGLREAFVQDNCSRSARHVLRGLHLQHPNQQGKLVTALAGEILDVAVDVRRGSPTFGRWAACALSAENGRQLYIPPGFAHGFVVVSDGAIVCYKCTAAYSAADEVAIRWDDPAIGIAWPVDTPLLSPKDATAPTLAEIPPERLPAYDGAAGGGAAHRTTAGREGSGRG